MVKGIENFKTKNRLGVPPNQEEASNNLQAPEVAPLSSERLNEHTEDRFLDGRSLRRTGRTVQFATRVTPDFDRRIRILAKSQGVLIVEVLERALDVYEKMYKQDIK